jgi:hypothetical protein
MTPTPIASDAPASNRLRLDASGRAIPLTDAELEEFAESARLALESLAAIPDDPPGSDEAFMRAIDEGRPERPLFRGLYSP